MKTILEFSWLTFLGSIPLIALFSFCYLYRWLHRRKRKQASENADYLPEDFNRLDGFEAVKQGDPRKA